MDDEEFQIMLREAFTVEAAEQVQAMTSCLIDLEKSPKPKRRQELVETIFREAHNLKGSAGAVNEINIQNLCQVLESIFSEWKKGGEIRLELFDLLNRAVDLVTELLEAGATGGEGEAESPEVAEMIGLLEGREEPSSADSGGAPPAPGDEGGEASSAAEGETDDAGKEKKKPPTSEPGPVASETSSARPAPADDPGPTAKPRATKSAETVRIPVSKMDALLRQAEEMVSTKLILRQHSVELAALGEMFSEWHKGATKIGDLMRAEAEGLDPESISRIVAFLQWNQSYVQRIEKDVAKLSGSASRDEHTVGSQVDGLLEDAKQLVTLPVGILFDLFPKMARDISRDLDKQVDLALEGREVEIDKRILQEMKDPLIHLVRNSIDHGIEPGEIRSARGKPDVGALNIAVTQRDGNKVEIVISDDGGGIDVEKLKAKAVSNEILSPEEAAEMDDESAFFLIFHSGMSTSELVTEISGRGLGMAIVREKVEKLGGNIAIESAAGVGTTFRILLPVTLATFKGVLVAAGGQTFAIPTSNVERIARYRPADVKTVENRETLLLDGQPVALVPMDAVLELPPQVEDETHEFREMVVLGGGDRRIAFTLDAVIDEQELLVKPIGSPLLRVRNVAGAAILGSGAAVVILNTPDLLQSAVNSVATGGGKRRPAKARRDEKQPRKILVADDSVTSRMLLKNILESAGYDVTTAIDGVDALTALKSGKFDILVSDVEMPRMDGFDLTATVRADQKFGELPVVLVTSLSSREHQERGIDVGANAYVVKSRFDQSNLLEIIGTFI